MYKNGFSWTACDTLQMKWNHDKHNGRFTWETKCIFARISNVNELNKYIGKAVAAHHTKAYGGEEVQLHWFLISALETEEQSTTRPTALLRYSLNSRLRGPTADSQVQEKKKKSLLLLGFEPWIIQAVGW